MTGVLTGKANPMTGSDLTLSEILTAAGYRSHAVIPPGGAALHQPDDVDPGLRQPRR